MYVKGVEKYTVSAHNVFAHNFLNIQLIFNPKKVLKAETWGFPTIPANTIYVEGVERNFNV